MKRILLSLVGAMTAWMILSTPSAGAAAPPSAQTWDMRGEYTINFTCLTTCLPPAVPHHITITSDNLLTGAFSGTGDTDNGPYTMNVTGNVTGDNVSMFILYTGENAGYYASLTGTISPDGSFWGSGSDSSGTLYSWSATGTATMTDYNHGQFVQGAADKAAMAQSNLGVPIGY